jgi:hypothetical protein
VLRVYDVSLEKALFRCGIFFPNLTNSVSSVSRDGAEYVCSVRRLPIFDQAQGELCIHDFRASGKLDDLRSAVGFFETALKCVGENIELQDLWLKTMIDLLQFETDSSFFEKALCSLLLFSKHLKSSRFDEIQRAVSRCVAQIDGSCCRFNHLVVEFWKSKNLGSPESVLSCLKLVKMNFPLSQECIDLVFQDLLQPFRITRLIHDNSWNMVEAKTPESFAVSIMDLLTHGCMFWIQFVLILIHDIALPNSSAVIQQIKLELNSLKDQKPPEVEDVLALPSQLNQFLVTFFIIWRSSPNEQSVLSEYYKLLFTFLEDKVIEKVEQEVIDHPEDLQVLKSFCEYFGIGWSDDEVMNSIWELLLIIHFSEPTKRADYRITYFLTLVSLKYKFRSHHTSILLNGICDFVFTKPHL